MSEIIKELAECLLLREVMRLEGHVKVLADVKVEIFTDAEHSFFRDFRNLALPYMKILNHPEKIRWKTDYKGLPNMTENVTVGLDDMLEPPFDNYTDVQVQVTQNVWGFDMDVTVMGGQRKKVYFRDKLIMDSAERRIDWFPLFRDYMDLKGQVEFEWR